MELKASSILKKKDKLVKKLKAKIGEGEEEEEEEEDEEEEQAEAQEPHALTQGMEEDKEEEETKDAKGEEVKEEPTLSKPKKRKAKAQLVAKAKKIVRPSPPKRTAPTNRAST